MPRLARALTPEAGLTPEDAGWPGTPAWPWEAGRLERAVDDAEALLRAATTRAGFA